MSSSTDVCSASHPPKSSGFPVAAKCLAMADDPVMTPSGVFKCGRFPDSWVALLT